MSEETLQPNLTHHDPMWLRKLLPLEDGTPFGEKMEEWQEQDFRSEDEHPELNTYIERPRGHSKTFDTAVNIVTRMLLGPPRQQLYGLAADEEQGELLLKDVAGIFGRHPGLRSLVKIMAKTVTVKKTGTVYTNLNSNAPTLYGLRPDAVYVDELVEHRRRDAWDALWTATGKRKGCTVHIISTPGWDRAHFAWPIREHARTDPAWIFSSRGQCASWISPVWLRQQQRTLPEHVYARLHEGRWSEGGGAWLSAAQVEAIFGAVPEGEGSRCIGLDIGISRDRTVAAAVKSVGGFAVVEHLEIYTPTKHDRVDLSVVEQDVYTLALRLGASVFLDPYQAVGIAQRLRDRGINVCEYAFTADKRRTLFAKLLDYISTGRLRARPHEEFQRELLSLEVKESLSGWRVDHRSSGHDDIVVAVSLGLAGLADGDGAGRWELDRAEERIVTLAAAAAEQASQENINALHEAKKQLSEARKNYIGNKFGFW